MSYLLSNNADGYKITSSELNLVVLEWKKDPNRNQIYVTPGSISTPEGSLIPRFLGIPLNGVYEKDPPVHEVKIKEGEDLYVYAKFSVRGLKMTSAEFEIEDIRDDFICEFTRIEEFDFFTGQYDDIDCIIAIEGQEDESGDTFNRSDDTTQGTLPNVIDRGKNTAVFYRRIAIVSKTKNGLDIVQTADLRNYSPRVSFNFTNLTNFCPNFPSIYIPISLSLPVL